MLESNDADSVEWTRRAAGLNASNYFGDFLEGRRKVSSEGGGGRGVGGHPVWSVERPAGFFFEYIPEKWASQTRLSNAGAIFSVLMKFFINPRDFVCIRKSGYNRVGVWGSP